MRARRRDTSGIFFSFCEYHSVRRKTIINICYHWCVDSIDTDDIFNIIECRYTLTVYFTLGISFFFLKYKHRFLWVFNDACIKRAGYRTTVKCKFLTKRLSGEFFPLRYYPCTINSTFIVLYFTRFTRRASWDVDFFFSRRSKI